MAQQEGRSFGVAKVTLSHVSRWLRSSHAS